MRVKWPTIKTSGANADSPYQYSDVHGFVCEAGAGAGSVQGIVTFNGRLIALPIGWLEVVGEEE